MAPSRFTAARSNRARHTACPIATRLGLEPERHHISPLLAEHAFGHWEGFTDEEIEVRFPGSLEARHRAHWTYVVPAGESYQQVYRRACQWLESLGDTPVTITVTHAKTSRTLRGAYLGLEPSGILSLKHPQDRIFAMKGGDVSAISCVSQIS